MTGLDMKKPALGGMLLLKDENGLYRLHANQERCFTGCCFHLRCLAWDYWSGFVEPFPSISNPVGVPALYGS